MKNLDPSLEIQKYFEEIDQKMSCIDDLRYAIGCLTNRLESIDADLLDCYMRLELAKEICSRALAGEPIAIWAELQRFGL
ncbi:hypothetical protein J4G07_18330 [Candidatus Poribacteria bacterium]|nr:hypothetical protein [Candidatus Poribacteria bacterium]